MLLGDNDCLFIGGPFDGQKRCIAGGNNTIALPCFNGGDFPIEARYFRIPPFLFVHESLSSQEAKRLITGKLLSGSWRLPTADDDGKYCYIRYHNSDAPPHKIKCHVDRWFYLDERNKQWQEFYCEIARVDRPE